MAKYTSKKDETASQKENDFSAVEEKKESTKKIENTVKEDTKPEKKTVTESKVKKEHDPADNIPCRSVVSGVLVLEGSKTKMPYSWSDYGDVTEVEYRDLVPLISEKSGYVFNPFFIIDDESVVEEFPFLQKFYNDNYSIKELSDILELSVNEMTEQIKALPVSAIESLKKIAAVQVSSGQIDSISKIRALDNIFGTDLNLISEVLN